MNNTRWGEEGGENEGKGRDTEEVGERKVRGKTERKTVKGEGEVGVKNEGDIRE